MLKIRVGVAAFAGATLSVTGLAQTGSSSDSESGLQEIVVTATRQAEVLSRVPLSVTALNQQALDDRGIRNVSDLFQLVPGVQFANTAFGTQTQISIRGISSNVGPGVSYYRRDGGYINRTPDPQQAGPDEPQSNRTGPIRWCSMASWAGSQPTG